MEAAKPGQPAATTFSHVKAGDTGFIAGKRYSLVFKVKGLSTG